MTGKRDFAEVLAEILAEVEAHFIAEDQEFEAREAALAAFLRRGAEDDEGAS